MYNREVTKPYCEHVTPHGCQIVFVHECQFDIRWNRSDAAIFLRHSYRLMLSGQRKCWVCYPLSDVCRKQTVRIPPSTWNTARRWRWRAKPNWWRCICSILEKKPHWARHHDRKLWAPHCHVSFAANPARSPTQSCHRNETAKRVFFLLWPLCLVFAAVMF